MGNNDPFILIHLPDEFYGGTAVRHARHAHDEVSVACYGVRHRIVSINQNSRQAITHVPCEVVHSGLEGLTASSHRETCLVHYCG